MLARASAATVRAVRSASGWSSCGSNDWSSPTSGPSSMSIRAQARSSRRAVACARSSASRRCSVCWSKRALASADGQRTPWKRSSTLSSSWWPSWNGVAVKNNIFSNMSPSGPRRASASCSASSLSKSRARRLGFLTWCASSRISRGRRTSRDPRQWAQASFSAWLSCRRAARMRDANLELRRSGTAASASRSAVRSTFLSARTSAKGTGSSSSGFCGRHCSQTSRHWLTGTSSSAAAV